MNRLIREVVGWSAALLIGGGAGLGGLKVFERFETEPAESCAAEREADDGGVHHDIPIGHAPSRGAASPKVTVVEFLDFECPYCAKLAQILRDVETKNSDWVRVVFRHNPLSIHARAIQLAKAAAAARTQDRFWEMYDRLIALALRHQADPDAASFSDANIERAATEAGLDVARWRRDLESSDVARQLADDAELVKTLKLRSAPIMFINGYRYPGLLSVDKLNEIMHQRRDP